LLLCGLTQKTSVCAFPLLYPPPRFQVRFNVKHQTPAENQVLLDMWSAVSAQWWGDRLEAVGLTGQVATEAPVGIMVSGWVGGWVGG